MSEDIENLRIWIEYEKEAIVAFRRKIKNSQVCLDLSIANLKKFEERLAAELSQVRA